MILLIQFWCNVRVDVLNFIPIPLLAGSSPPTYSIDKIAGKGQQAKSGVSLLDLKRCKT